jgi:hypothetical protein
VPAGDYDLTVDVYAKPSGCLVDPLARTTVRVRVTEADARGQLVLPEIKATVVPRCPPPVLRKVVARDPATFADCRRHSGPCS